MPVVGAVEVPFQHLSAAVTGGDLRRQDALADGAARRGRLVPQQQVGDQLLRKRRMAFGIVPALEDVTRLIPEIRFGEGDGRISQGLGQMGGSLRVEGYVRTRCLVGNQRGQQVLAAAVVEARRLEQESVLRVEHEGQGGDGGQTAHQVRVEQYQAQG